jgi:hypothetical protein
LPYITLRDPFSSLVFWAHVLTGSDKSDGFRERAGDVWICHKSIVDLPFTFFGSVSLQLYSANQQGIKSLNVSQRIKSGGFAGCLIPSEISRRAPRSLLAPEFHFQTSSLIVKVPYSLRYLKWLVWSLTLYFLEESRFLFLHSQTLVCLPAHLQTQFPRSCLVEDCGFRDGHCFPLEQSVGFLMRRVVCFFHLDALTTLSQQR